MSITHGRTQEMLASSIHPTWSTLTTLFPKRYLYGGTEQSTGLTLIFLYRLYHQRKKYQNSRVGRKKARSSIEDILREIHFSYNLTSNIRSTGLFFFFIVFPSKKHKYIQKIIFLHKVLLSLCTFSISRCTTHTHSF